MKNRTAAIQPKKSRFRLAGEVIGELGKVVWPTRQEAIRLSVIVAAVCILVGLVLGIIDFGFSELITKVFLGLQ